LTPINTAFVPFSNAVQKDLSIYLYGDGWGMDIIYPVGANCVRPQRKTNPHNAGGETLPKKSINKQSIG
jgi:hypothetical protein